MDIYAAARPGAFSPAGWAPVGIHSLLMTASSVPGATALIGWLLQRRNDEVYTAAYRHGCQDTLNALTVEETAPVRLHQRRASQYPSA